MNGPGLLEEVINRSVMQSELPSHSPVSPPMTVQCNQITSVFAGNALSHCGLKNVSHTEGGKKGRVEVISVAFWATTSNSGGNIQRCLFLPVSTEINTYLSYVFFFFLREYFLFLNVI